MRRKKWWIVFGLVLTGVSAFFFYPNTPEFAVLESPIPLEILRVEDVGLKPKVDLNLPLVGRLIYPKAREIPYRMNDLGTSKDDRDCQICWAGFVWPLENPKARPSFFLLSYYEWVIDAETQAVASPNYIYGALRCPRVFGQEAIEATVEMMPLANLARQSIKMRLPPNGIPAPKLPSLKTKVGSWTLTFEPKPWLSPTFPIRYAISVQDDLGSVFLVDKNTKEGRTWGPFLRCVPDQPGILPFNSRESPSIFESLEFDARKMNLTVTRLQPKPERFRFQHLKTTEGTSVKILDSKDRMLYIWGRNSLESSFLDQRTQLKIGDQLFNWDTRANFVKEERLWQSLIQNFQDGEIVAGEIYTPVETRTVTVSLFLPDIKKYRDHKHN